MRTPENALTYRQFQYLRPWARPGAPNRVALDVKEQEKLWSWLEDQVKEYQ